MATTRDNKIGRVRERLAGLLRAEGFDVHPADLNSQVPWYANPRWDCCSWYGDGVHITTGLEVHFASWDTMTACVRYGIELTQDEDHVAHYEISRKEA